MIEGEAVCLGCGCTDSHACVDEWSSEGAPCFWLEVNYEVGIGACSNCAEWEYAVRNWDAFTSRRRRDPNCKRCGFRRSWLVARSPVVGLIALQYCEGCDLGFCA